MNSFEIMIKALRSLDSKLLLKGLSADITILGSVAVYLNSLMSSGHTSDIDYLGNEFGDDVKELIQEVAEELNLELDWINNRANDIYPLPVGFEDRLQNLSGFKALKVKYLHREDLIMLKIYSF